MTKLFCLKCFFKEVSSDSFNIKSWIAREIYLDVPFSARLEIIKYRTTSIDGLTVQQFLDEPEDQARFALFCLWC